VDQLKTDPYVVHAFMEGIVLWLLVQMQWLALSQFLTTTIDKKYSVLAIFLMWVEMLE
jgi:hypothetical protein